MVLSREEIRLLTRSVILLHLHRFVQQEEYFYTIDPLIVDICADAAKTHTYYIPYPENQSYTALEASEVPQCQVIISRTVISIKILILG